MKPKSKKKFRLGPLQKQWLKHLESGRITQGKNVLFDGTGYCCLGVAAHCVLKLELTFEPQKLGAGSTYRIGGAVDALKERDRKRMGLRRRLGVIGQVARPAFGKAIWLAGYRGSGYNSLSDYNDCGATFAQIAAAIRAVPEAVFSTSK